jgi:hypothetical protein
MTSTGTSLRWSWSRTPTSLPCSIRTWTGSRDPDGDLNLQMRTGDYRMPGSKRSRTWSHAMGGGCSAGTPANPTRPGSTGNSPTRIGLRHKNVVPNAQHHAACPACSTFQANDLGQPVIQGRSVPLSGGGGCPERRSNDGQMILNALPPSWKLGLDLRFRGAPLRNRTVDLLLTMETLCRLS